ncbi:alpha/beta fold hydrolase [Nocardioides aestuarii]|uniref:Alpha/beta fold hydrolase n=1 Tax=Nocardioides aestuarii TaxID=252231 RepID=A0ABW4TR16_9ACTN
MTDRLRHIDHDGLRFDVRDEGPVDGDPVVLLHGFPQRASSWDRVTPRLHAEGLRTLAPDQRGYSPGARPPRRRDYTLDRLVADVEALVTAVGRPVHLVGHDWGAAVAWLLAARRPDLVRSLVAVSVPHPGAMVAAGRRQWRLSWYMGLFLLPGVAERQLPSPRGLGALRAGGMTDEMLRTFRTEVVADGALPGALAWYRAIPLTPRGLRHERVSVPTTMVWSDGDVAIARATAELAARWVDARYDLVVLPGVSHWIPDQAPAAVADAVLTHAHREAP